MNVTTFLQTSSPLFKPTIQNTLYLRRRSESDVIIASSSPFFLRTPFNPTPLTLSLRRRSSPSPRISAGQNRPNPTRSPLTGSTQTTTHFALALALISKLLASKISLLSLIKFIAIHPNPNNTLSTTVPVGPLLFAWISNGSDPSSMGTPIWAILARLDKWLDLFLSVLKIRVLLSLFPNIQWNKPPMSAVRDLFEPDPSLFRGINQALAFLVLGILRGFFSTPPSPY